VDEPTSNDGVVAVAMPCSVALFGDARTAPKGLDSDTLAAAAGDAIERRTGHTVPVLYGRQEHSRLTFTFSATHPLPAGPHLVGTCDALLTAEPWTALTVRSADCLPVVLAGNGAVALIHAGWRGLAADVLGAALGRMRVEFGVPAATVRAVVGVGIGPCHYRVGDEVVTALSYHPVRGDGWHAAGAVDLAAWAKGRMLALGVQEEGIRVLPGCTACSPSHHSYRRDGEQAGRQWTAVLITEALRPFTP
jgi:YfiH family protein